MPTDAPIPTYFGAMPASSNEIRRLCVDLRPLPCAHSCSGIVSTYIVKASRPARAFNFGGFTSAVAAVLQLHHVR